MYADTVTDSMKRAIDEVERRRRIQEAYNKKHDIKPQSIKKAVRDSHLSGRKTEKAPPPPYDHIPEDEIAHLIKNLENQMELAARNLEFEKAAVLRDQIKILKEKTKEKNIKKKSRQDQFASLKALRE
jgi:excinuclease ABC subunit B